MFGTDPSKAPELLRASPQLLGSLPYTTAVIKETLRLTASRSLCPPPFPGLFFLLPSSSSPFDINIYIFMVWQLTTVLVVLHFYFQVLCY